MAKITKEMIKEAKREYHRKYRKNNRERIKRINDNYWARKAKKKLGNKI